MILPFLATDLSYTCMSSTGGNKFVLLYPYNVDYDVLILTFSKQAFNESLDFRNRP